MTTCAEGRTAVLIFARAPVPGEAKTRLIPLLGARAAARLHERMTEHAIAAASSAAIGPIELWCTPSIAHPYFDRCAQRHRLSLHAQAGHTLGERLLDAHRRALGRHERVLLMGTDCPMLNAQRLQTAAAALDDSDAVIVPADDGGYALLGLTRVCERAFEAIDWGSSRVYTQTMARLRDERRSCRVLDALWDVDRPEDYLRLSALCPELTDGLRESTRPRLAPCRN